MRLLGRVHDRPARAGFDQRLTCAGERGYVGGGATADEDAAGGVGIADPLLEPIEYDQLQMTRARGRGPAAGIDVECAGDQVTERARERARGRYEREVARVREPAHVRE